MTPEEIIEKAREEWCVERRGVRGLSQETDHTPACPPKVVAALLYVLEKWSRHYPELFTAERNALAAIEKELSK